MSDNQDWVTINAILKKKNAVGIEKPIAARIVCKYQFAVAMFSDKALAKKLSKAEARSGKDVRYDEGLNVMVERFPEKSAREVSEIITKQMEDNGGTISK